MLWTAFLALLFQIFPFPGPSPRNSSTIPSTAFVTAASLSGGTRNDNPGFVGMQITIGASPITVTDLGRIFITGNTTTHTVRIARVSDQGTVVDATWSPSGGVNGTFNYTHISDTTLSASTSYFLISDEQVSGDFWGQAAPVTVTSVATVDGQVYTDGGGLYTLVLSTSGNSYVPPGFKYHL